MGLLGKLFQRTPRFSYELPHGWTEERVEGGLLLLAPVQEGGWQANIFLELRTDAEDRDLEVALRELLANLRRHKRIIRVLGSGVAEIAPGVPAGTLHYVHVSDGLEIREREILVPLAGRDVVFVLTSALDALAATYDPIFDRFLATVSGR